MFIIALLFLPSCMPPLERLDEKTIQGTDIKVRSWTTSSISTMHEHVEVVKGLKSKKILEVNDGAIQSIEIVKDTIAIQISGGPIYTVEDSAYGYWIVLDRNP